MDDPILDLGERGGPARDAYTEIPTGIAVHKILKPILGMFSSLIQLLLPLKHISIPHPTSASTKNILVAHPTSIFTAIIQHQNHFFITRLFSL